MVHIHHHHQPNNVLTAGTQTFLMTGLHASPVRIGGCIFIIRPPQSTAGHRPLQFLAISLDPRLLASSSCQPSCANRYSTWPEGVLHYVYRDAVSTLELVYPSGCGYTADVASPLPLQHANTVCFVGDFSSLPDGGVLKTVGAIDCNYYINKF
jgi:hypothetical protein